MSTVGLCGTKYGGDEVVVEAILAWLFEGGEGDLGIAATGEKDVTQRRAVITMEKLKSSSELEENGRSFEATIRVHRNY